MFGLDKFFKGNGDKKDAEQHQGPDPSKIRQLLEEHPSFQILTVDGLKWIDPHTLTCVDCPFGYVDTALAWLLQHQPWHEHKCRSPKEVRMCRWRMHISENIDLDPRWKIFDNDGIWLNPFTAEWEERVTINDAKVSRETITLMARTLIECDEEQLEELMPAKELDRVLRSNGDRKQETEQIIKSTERFEVKDRQGASLPAAPTLQDTPDNESTMATDFDVQPNDPDRSAATEYQMHNVSTTEATMALPSDRDPDKTMDVDFSQGSLIEEPAPDKPLRVKEQTHDAEQHDVGKQIAGYKIISFLGKGGMGDVHKAIQMSMQREVALKILPPQLCRDETFSNRFIREARAAGKVNHPNVITCYDVGNDQGVLYMALELVTGGDVSQLMKKNAQPLSPKKALRILIDCTRGLAAIHKAGLIHRDIKPANIFLSEDGTAKLADLGLARSSANSTQMTQAGTSVGTPAYMSPEQVKGEDDIDIRTDIYALGITFYTMLSGQNPFQANDVWALFRMIVQDDMPDITAQCADLDPAIGALIQRCCAKDRNDRFNDPYAMLEALDQIN